MADDSLFHLSAREVELTELVACGYSNQEIAQRLFLSRDTVKTHLKRVFGKCGFRNRVELASWWASQRAGETSREAAIDKPPCALTRSWRPGRRALIVGTSALATLAAVVVGWLFVPGFGVLASDDASGSVIPILGGCQVGDTTVMWWPALEERPVTPPGVTTTTYAMYGEARSIVLPGYSATMEVVSQDSAGQPVYGCPERYGLNEADLEALTGP